MRLALEGEEGLEWGGRLSSARWDATRCLRAGRQDHQAVKSEANVGQAQASCKAPGWSQRGGARRAPTDLWPDGCRGRGVALSLQPSFCSLFTLHFLHHFLYSLPLL